MKNKIKLKWYHKNSKRKFIEFKNEKNLKGSKMLLYDVLRASINKEISIEKLLNVIEYLNIVR